MDDLEKQQGTSSMLLQALCIISEPLVNSNLSYSPETTNLGQIRRFLELCDLEIWRMTLKNNRAPLLSNIKLYASFHHHMWIQTGVTVRKRLSWIVTSVTLTFDLWPWPFAWTLLWSLVITPENFMMIQWWEHSQQELPVRKQIRPRPSGFELNWYGQDCTPVMKNSSSERKTKTHKIARNWNFIKYKSIQISTNAFLNSSDVEVDEMGWITVISHSLLYMESHIRG